MKTEAQFRTVVMLEATALGAHVTHIESPVASAGVPDLNFYCRHADVWLELKLIGPDEKVHMRPTQRKWHRERWRAGGVSWVLVLDPPTGNLLLVPGEQAHALNEHWHAWRDVAVFSTVSELPKLLNYIIQGTLRHEQRHFEQYRAADSEPAPVAEGKALPSFPAGSPDLVGHHWLTDKP